MMKDHRMSNFIDAEIVDEKLKMRADYFDRLGV